MLFRFALVPSVAREGKTPVTILQELLLKKKTVPTYELIQNAGGSHDPIFTYQVTADGQRATGSGKSKKEAKHNAANNLLVEMKVKEAVPVIDEVVASPYEGAIKENAVGDLLDFCAINHLRPPEYKLTRDEGLPHAKVFSWACTVSSFTTEGTARTKKNAKQLAAQEMLLKLKEYLADIVISPVESPNATPSRNIVNIMESALDEVVKVLPRKKLHSSSKLGLNVADMCYAMRDDHQPDLEYLDSIKDKNSEWVEGQDHEEVLKKITEELQCDFDFRPAETAEPSMVGLFLTVNSVPAWTFLAFGESSAEARAAACKEAVQFMIKMRR